jgi:hypothetical protein
MRSCSQQTEVFCSMSQVRLLCSACKYLSPRPRISVFQEFLRVGLRGALICQGSQGFSSALVATQPIFLLFMAPQYAAISVFRKHVRVPERVASPVVCLHPAWIRAKDAMVHTCQDCLFTWASHRYSRSKLVKCDR